MRNFFSAWYNRYAVMTLTAALALGCYESIGWSGLTASDWGVWVGGLGTVATLVGTIVLATANNRTTKRQEMDRAVVAAATLGPRLEKICKALQNAVETFLDFGPESHPAAYTSHASAIEKAGNWSADEIIPLIVLPNHLATRLAGTSTLLTLVTKEMRDLDQTWAYSWVQDNLAERQGKIAADLIMCRDVVQFASAECKAVVQKAIRS